MDVKIGVLELRVGQAMPEREQRFDLETVVPAVSLEDAIRGEVDGLVAVWSGHETGQKDARIARTVAVGGGAWVRELELPAFEKAVRAGAGAVMCAYSRVNDVYSCSNELLLQQRFTGAFDFWPLVRCTRGGDPKKCVSRRDWWDEAE